MQLPASRALAEQLGLSRNTVMAVYDLLLSEGQIVSRPGAGTFVAPSTPRPAAGERPSVRCETPDAAAIGYDFRPGLPDTASFPFDIWGRLSGRALRQFSRASAGYREPAGHPALREAIAGHLSFARHISCAPENVVVTVGAQQAFDLLARTLVTAARPIVAVEDPGYPATRVAFEAAGAQICAVPVDSEGLVVESLPKDAAVICVTPSQQFPMGAPMSPRRRQALLAFATERQAMIVEDDYGGEFWFGGRPLDSLRALDRHERVFYVGTFSKGLLPALRIGFVIAPDRALQALVAARQLSDWHGPAIEHATLAAFITEGHLARHIRRMRKTYAGRRIALLEALREHCSGLLEPLPTAAGLHVPVLLREPFDAQAVVARAARLGVAIESLSVFAVARPPPAGFALGYGQIEADRIDGGMRTLTEAIRDGA